jgi:hypothetical protein
MRHTGSDTDSLTAQIGVAAKLRVKEDWRGPQLVQWEPIPRRVEAPVSAKANRVAGAGPDQTNEPSVGPGAAAATKFPTVPKRAASRAKRASTARRGQVPK